MNLFVLYRYVRFLLRGRLPREVMLDISGVCNASCRYCPRMDMPDSRKKLMTMETFHIALDEIQKYGIKKVRLYSTGEPTLHPDFDRMVRCLHDAGISITVSTNGSHLMEHRDALLLVDHIQLSISGWDKESYEFLHYPLKFDDIRKQVREFYWFAADYGQCMEHPLPFISINMLLTRKTDVILFMRHWAGYADKVTQHPLTGFSRFEGGCFVNVQPSVLKEYFFSYLIDRSRGCSYPFDTLVVSFDGKIGLCCADYCHVLPLGYVHDGLKTVFNAYYLRGVRHGFLHGVPDVCCGCSRFLKVDK